MNVGNVLAGTVAAALPAVAGSSGKVAGSSGKVANAAIARALVPSAGAPGGLSVADRLKNAGAPTAQRHAEQFGALLTRFARSALGGEGTGAGCTGSLAFLRDGRLSVEEKLARLMVHLSDKYEKQLEQKLQQYADLESGKGTPGTKKAAASGGLTAITEGVSSLLSKTGFGKLLGGTATKKLVGQLAGPVLSGAATALGMPFLAGPLLKAGPLVAGLASGAAGALGSGAAAGAKAAGAGGASSSGAPSEKQLMTEIQILQEKQKEMFSLVSNILRSLHDTKMAVISNVR